MNKGILLEEASPEEVTLEVPHSEALSCFAFFHQLHVPMLASNYFVSDANFIDSNKCSIWILDSGNRIRNVIQADMFGNVKQIQKSKGARQLSSDKTLTTYQFRAWIQELQKQGLVVISHSPLSETGIKCVYF
jgi:hypothetical protein